MYPKISIVALHPPTSLPSPPTSCLATDIVTSNSQHSSTPAFRSLTQHYLSNIRSFAYFRTYRKVLRLSGEQLTNKSRVSTSLARKSGVGTSLAKWLYKTHPIRKSFISFCCWDTNERTIHINIMNRKGNPIMKTKSNPTNKNPKQIKQQAPTVFKSTSTAPESSCDVSLHKTPVTFSPARENRAFPLSTITNCKPQEEHAREHFL